MLANVIVIVLKYLFVAVGRLMIRLSFGREGWKAAEALKKVNNGLAFFLTIGFFFWVYCVAAVVQFVAGELMNGLGGFILWAILFPFIYVLWFVYARKVTVPALIEEAKPIFDRIEESKRKQHVNNQAAAAEAAKANSWTCTCGRTHAMYVSSCVCGTTKQEAEKNTTQL